MEDSGSVGQTALLTRFTDVLYITDRGQIPHEVRRLLKQKRLSHAVISTGQYEQIRDHLDSVGTVIVDAEGLDVARREKLAWIIESLEMENIGVVILTGRVETLDKSFSVSSAKSTFAMTGSAETVSVDDLWGRISVNLAYRKKASAIAVRPARTPGQPQRAYKSKLAEQLQMAESLVETLAEQLRLAGLVQKDFLPAQLPNDDRFRWATVFQPAEWVSGDIYNIARLDEKHVGFYVADVVGHGMPAALLTIFLKQALVMRETTDNSYRIFSPAEAMKNLNVKMAAQKLSGYQFATCCYCLLNTETLQLTYARAGHPYPILFRQDQEPKQLEVRGSLLGVFEQAEYDDATVQLQRGDRLLIYSDGAERFVGGYDDETGFHYSEEFLALQDLPVTSMTDRLKVFVHDVEIASAEVDDVTAIGLEIL